EMETLDKMEEPEAHLVHPDSTARRAIPGYATRKGQREFLL
ncbi:hypothetical protein A2U01_0113735, partial [Trifolium medium]|nr:hypothetical protein [Trifolium medium]